MQMFANMTVVPPGFPPMARMVVPLLVACVLVFASEQTQGQTMLPPTVEVPYEPYEENLYPQYVYREPGTDRLLRLAFSTPYRPDTPEGGRTYRMWYQVKPEGVGIYDTIRPLIQDGDQYNETHPIDPVYINDERDLTWWEEWVLGYPSVVRNSYVASTQPPSRASNGEILVPFWIRPLDEMGALKHENDTYSFHEAGVLVGQWADNNTDVRWQLGDMVSLDFATQSRRGSMEPAVVELQNPGEILMVMRASNEGDTSMPSHKWIAVSDDYARTWSDPEPFKFNDGEAFLSPSSSSDIRRHSQDGNLYWFGNISDDNPDGNHPRYPLVVGQVDEDTLMLKRETLQVVATRDPDAGDSPEVQFSNFNVTEDLETGAFIITLSRIDFERYPVDHAGDYDWPRERYEVFIPEPGAVGPVAIATVMFLRRRR